MLEQQRVQPASQLGGRPVPGRQVRQAQRQRLTVLVELGGRPVPGRHVRPASDSAGGLQDEAATGEPNCGRARDGATAERAAAAAELVPNESATARLGAEARTAGRADSPQRRTELSALRQSTRIAAPPRRYIEEV